MLFAVAESIGVTAEPEVMAMEITPSHPFMVIASDGVWEFLPSQDVVDMVSVLCVCLSVCTSVCMCVCVCSRVCAATCSASIRVPILV